MLGCRCIGVFEDFHKMLTTPVRVHNAVPRAIIQREPSPLLLFPNSEEYLE
jgi:hypothetical protein